MSDTDIKYDPLIACRDVLRRTGTNWPAVYRVVPQSVDGDKLIILTSGSIEDERLISELELLTGMCIKLKHCEAGKLNELLVTHFSEGGNHEVDDFDPTSSSDPQMLVETARARRASDIHFEMMKDEGRIRLRLDGKLKETWVIPAETYHALVNRVKIMSGMDISRRRMPQDGRFDTHDVDVRVSSIPSLYGEKLTLRLLQKDSSGITLAKLGMPEHMLRKYTSTVGKAWGMILISGPTGSGKTTTLYATIRKIQNPGINILTVEDPVEYRFEGISQVQVHESIGLDFACVLRAFLRQDPDVIMIGEIRDAETARIATRAALTGHLVLSTIHTNSATETFTRLTEMGIKPYIQAGTVIASVAQRLVRRLCEKCKQKQKAPPSIWPNPSRWPPNHSFFFEPTGCPSCQYTGFDGRVPVFELLIPDETMREQVRKGVFQVETKGESLENQAMQLVYLGKTSPGEILSIIKSDTM